MNLVENMPWHLRSKEQAYQMFQLQPAVQNDYSGRSDYLVGYSVIPDLLERFHSLKTLLSTDFST
jgi:hypothetical protein